MMHVGANNAPSSSKKDSDKYEAIAFTNVLEDARKDATKLFDVASKDTGVCKNRGAGGITTYDQRWSEYTDNWKQQKNKDANKGSCLVGDGHHFCSVGREGARFSNAIGIQRGKGENQTDVECGGSGWDTVYWAWESDSLRCGGYTEGKDAMLPLIGTGCSGYNKPDTVKNFKPKPRMPLYRYSFLFLY